MVRVSGVARRGRHFERVGGRRQRRPSAEQPRGRATRLAGVVIFVCAVLSALVATDHLANAGEIRRGVSVGDIALGGKTPGEARELLESRAPEVPEKVQLSGPGGSFVVPAADLGVRYDVGATIEEVYAVGRRGSLSERLGERARSVFGVSVPAEFATGPGP